MKTAGFLIFVVGIVISISAGAKLPKPPPASEETGGGKVTEAAPVQDANEAAAVDEAPARFPDTLGAFAGGAVVCVIGLTLWWKVVLAERQAARTAAGGDASAANANPVTILQQLQQSLSSILNDLDSLTEPDLQLRVDSAIDNHVTPLAESRHRIIDRFGMSHGAEILVATAYGERMLNRVWSAAADGYLDEARSSFREASIAFDEAAVMMSSADAST
jgi:hypothetical protein